MTYSACRINTFHYSNRYHYSVEIFSVPTNGLVIYCGTIVTDEGKEKKVNIDFEPFKPINTSLYLCDNKFHTEALQGRLNLFWLTILGSAASLRV